MVCQQNRTIAVVLALLLVVTQIVPAVAQSDSSTAQAQTPIRVGSAPSTEARLLSQMFVMLLEEAGFVVDVQTDFADAMALRTALEDNQLDLYPAYTGTALTDYNDLPVDALPNVAERVYELAKTLDEPRGISWLAPAPMNSTLALLVNQELADQGITSIAALADSVAADPEAYTICISGDFYARADGLLSLEDLYDLRFPEENVLLMESDEVYSNLRSGTCAIGQGNATDGRIAAWDLVVLEDSLNAFHFDQPAPVIRTDLLESEPALASLFTPLMTLLDTQTMRELSARVEVGGDAPSAEGEGESIEDVALSFLLSNGLIKPAPIRVGSKEFTEQLILGKLLVLLLRDAGFEVEDLTGAGGTALIRQMVEAGEIDVYPEYTGTATSVHHGIPVTALPTTAERAYVLAKSLDAPQGLTWLTPFAFNNTYTLLARQELIDEGIQTIDDLAVYMNANDAPLTLCVEGEFYARPDGLDGLQTLYGFAFQEDNIFVVETGDVYEKLRNGECDLAEGFSTDGRITAWNFVPLEDSLAFFPFYNPAPVVRQEVLDLHPEIAGLLNQLSGLLDEATMAALNAQVDIGPDGELASGDEASVEEVAYNFLRANRLVALPEIVVASTDATEGFQSILSNMLMLVLADAGYQPVMRTDLGGNLAVRTAMLNGEVDLYIETVTTALAEYHALPVAALPTTSERAYALAQNLDRENDIVWLDLLPYAETTALVEGEELTTLGIASLDDLALYMIANDSPLAICMDNEFFGSELNGIEALQQLYGFAFEPDKILLMAEDELLAGLESGECDVAATNRLDAAARGYSILEDPLGFFLTSGSAPVMRKTILDQNPELGTVINGLVALLDAETISDLDRQVELGEDGEEESGDEHDAYTVARDFLVENELIEPPVEEPTVEEAAEEGAGSQSTERENPAVEETGTEAPRPMQPQLRGREAGKRGRRPPPPPDSPALTQTNPSAEMLASASAGGGEGDAATASPGSPGIAREPGIIIASMTDTEQQLMGTMMVTLLRSAGYPVVDRTASGTSPDLRAMLESGEIDLYPEFTGVALSLYHNIPPSALPTTADGAFSLVKDLDAALNIAWIRKASFDSTYGLAVSPAVAARGLRTLLDLTAAVQADPTALTICVDDDFFSDAELGLASLAELYEMKPSPESIVLLADDEIYRSLRDGTCDVGKISRTDARVGAWQLTVLDDPLGAFPNYSPAPVTRNEVLARYPEMEQRLAALGPLLTPEVITDLNAQIELGQDGEPATGDEASIAQVATTFLCENQLMGDCTVIDNVATTATVMPDGTAAPDVTTEITPVLAMIPITNVTPGEASTLDLLVNEAIAAEEAVAPTAEPVVVSPTDENDESRPADADITISTPATFGVNAREAANATATVVAILPRATTVQAIGRTVDSSWLQILTADGEVAWVFTAAVISNPDRIAQLPVVEPAE